MQGQYGVTPVRSLLTLSRVKHNALTKPGSRALDTATEMLENASISNTTRTCSASVFHQSSKSLVKYHRTPRLEELPKEILYKIIRNLNPYDLESLSEASRHLTILIGLIPCRDPFTWALHRCRMHRHTRDDSLCGDCVLAFDKRIQWGNLLLLSLSASTDQISGVVFVNESTSVGRLSVDGVPPLSNIQHVAILISSMQRSQKHLLDTPW